MNKSLFKKYLIDSSIKSVWLVSESVKLPDVPIESNQAFMFIIISDDEMKNRKSVNFICTSSGSRSFYFDKVTNTVKMGLKKYNNGYINIGLVIVTPYADDFKITSVIGEWSADFYLSNVNPYPENNKVFIVNMDTNITINTPICGIDCLCVSNGKKELSIVGSRVLKFELSEKEFAIVVIY